MLSPISRKQFNSSNVELEYLPYHIERIEIICSNCREKFKPDWRAKVGAIESVRLNSKPGEQYFAIPQGMGLICPKCRHSNNFPIPQRKLGAYYYCFGDEAYRDLGDSHYLCCYTFVSIYDQDLEKASKVLGDMKNDLAEICGRDLGEFDLHMTDVFSAGKSGGYGLNKEQCVKFFSKSASRFSDSQGVIHTYTCFAVFEKSKVSWPKYLKRIKRHVMLNLMVALIDLQTSNNISPRFILEDDGKMGWVGEMFVQLRLSRFFPLIHKTIPLDAPKIVSKKSATPIESCGFQLADFVCFSIARTIHNLWDKKRVELDPRLLGKVNYIYRESKSKAFRSETSVGFPSSLMDEYMADSL